MKLLFIGILFSTTAFLAASKAKHTVQDEQSPIASFSTTGASDPNEQSLRLKRDKFYERFTFGLPALDLLDNGKPVNEGTIEITDCFAPGVRERLAIEAGTILVGATSDAKAFFSGNKKHVYTEFSFVIEQVIKDKATHPLNVNDRILIGRWGGRLRFPAGKVEQFTIKTLGMPKSGRRLVLFLERHEEEQFFYVITGYELGNGIISPLDNLDEHKLPFSAFRGSDELEFLKLIKEKVSQ